MQGILLCALYLCFAHRNKTKEGFSGKPDIIAGGNWNGLVSRQPKSGHLNKHEACAVLQPCRSMWLFHEDHVFMLTSTKKVWKTNPESLWKCSCCLRLVHGEFACNSTQSRSNTRNAWAIPARTPNCQAQSRFLTVAGLTCSPCVSLHPSGSNIVTQKIRCMHCAHWESTEMQFWLKWNKKYSALFRLQERTPHRLLFLHSVDWMHIPLAESLHKIPRQEYSILQLFIPKSHWDHSASYEPQPQNTQNFFPWDKGQELRNSRSYLLTLTDYYWSKVHCQGSWNCHQSCCLKCLIPRYPIAAVANLHISAHMYSAYELSAFSIYFHQQITRQGTRHPHHWFFAKESELHIASEAVCSDSCILLSPRVSKSSPLFQALRRETVTFTLVFGFFISSICKGFVQLYSLKQSVISQSTRIATCCRGNLWNTSANFCSLPATCFGHGCFHFIFLCG